MASNAQVFSDYYAKSVVDYWDTQRAEARALLIKEGDDNSAYIKSLESAIRAADDDIRGWVTVSDTRERAEMQALVRRNKEVQRESRRRAKNSRSAQKAAGSALSKPEEAAAKAATGQAETGSSLGMLFQGLGEERVKSVDAVVSALSSGTDLVRVLEQYKSGSPGSGASKDVRIALAHGIVRTAESVSHRKRGVGPSDKIIRLAAARMVGLADNEVARIGTYDALRQEEIARAASTVQSAKSSGAGAAAVAADLEARGWDPFDFLPEMEVDALSDRRASLQKKLEEARSAKVPDLDAALEAEMVKRTEGVGQGLQFGGGFLGAMQFGAHNKKRLSAAQAGVAQSQAKIDRLDSMDPNERRLFLSTARALQAMKEGGSTRPHGANKTLWGFGEQISRLNAKGGFPDTGTMVTTARGLISESSEFKGLSEEELEQNLMEVLEFVSINTLTNKGGSTPNVPTSPEIPEEEASALESVDSGARRRGERERAKDRGKSQADMNESGKKAAVRVAELEIERTQPTKDPRIVEGERLLQQRRRNLGRIKRDQNSSKTKITVAQKDVDEAKQQLDQIQEEIDAASYWDSASTGGGFGQDYDELLRKTRRGISSTHGSRVDKNAQPNPRKTPGRAAGTGGAIGVPGRVATNVFEKNMGRTITVADMAIAINEAIAAGETPPYISASTLAQNAGTFGNMFDPGGSAYSASPQEKRLRQAETLAKQARGGSEATQTQLESDVWNSRNDYFGDLIDANLSGELDQDTLLLDAVGR